MADPNVHPDPAPASGQGTPEPAKGHRTCGRGGCRRRGWFLAGLAIVAGLVGFGIGKAAGRHWGGPFGHSFGMHRTMDADTLSRRAETGIGRALGKVDASKEQKDKVAAIAKAAVGDLMPLQEQHRAARDKLAAVLRAEKVDRAAIEQLRADEVALAEKLSRRASEALIEAAEVLSPAQRARLVELWQSRGRRG